MAWIKLDRDRILNLNIATSIFINNAPSGYIIIVGFGGGYDYTSKVMAIEECYKAYELIQTKLFSNELIDISNETI